MLMNAESVAASFTLVETDEQRGKPKTLVDFSLLFFGGSGQRSDELDDLKVGL